MKTEYQLGLKTLLDTQNDLLEHEVKETGKLASKKRERSPMPEFKYKRNKIQFDINKSVIEKIENALDMSDDEERLATLNEGKDILVQSNKHKKSQRNTVGKALIVTWRSHQLQSRSQML